MLAVRFSRLRSALASVHADDIRIAKSAARISIFVLVAKCAGALKEMAIASRYGISDVVDAYQLTFTLSTFLPTILVTSTSGVLIPALVNLRTRTTAEQRTLLGELEVAGVVAGVLLTLLVWVLWDSLLRLIAGSLPEQTRQLSRELMFAMAPVGILIITIAVSAARLQARQRHVNTLLECVPAVTLLLFLLLTPDASSVAPLMWGTTLGFLLQAALLRFLAIGTDEVRTSLSLSSHSPQWPQLCRSMGLSLIGGVVVGFVTPLDQFFLGHLGGGAIATFGYANRVLALILTMGALAISRATLPILSEILSTGDLARARNTAFKWSFIMLGIGAIGGIIPWVFAQQAIGLLFERGAFTAQNTIAVAELFRWGLVQVPFYLSVLVLQQLFNSEGRFWEMTLICVVAFFVKAVANVILVRWFGMVGVILATGVMHVCSLACYLMVAWMRPAVRPPARST
ncbi:hypothetical protein GCT13_10855 [Paraburkholderia sp. CNPSo 3157]|uniref:Virulence factor MVIN family protein n=1 Tax=Paraburkholderia franconis TaxID=2654983 RepID=A0A7X1N8M5_9BURK|nr:lipid II flippase MurJ [Paraburkholderia franconis]MPW17417.1 hypothetical protein [Paraburkholderia franconis]